MIVTFIPVRETADKGGSLVWRLLVQRLAYEGAAVIAVSSSAGDTTLERTWTTARYGSGVTSPKRTSGEYSGPVADTLTFDATGGLVTYDITDKLSPARAPDIVEVSAVVNGVTYEAHGYTTYADNFTRGASLDGELVMQKLLQADDTDDEDYLEDMINKGWNIPNLFRWVEQLDGYVTALRLPPGGESIGSKFVTMNAITFGVDLTTGDGKAFFTVPPQLNSLTLRSVYGALSTASTSGVINVQLANVTDGYDFLTTKLTFDVNETTTGTASVPCVIDTSAGRNVVVAGDLIRLDVDAAGTNARNLQVTLGFG